VLSDFALTSSRGGAQTPCVPPASDDPFVDALTAYVTGPSTALVWRTDVDPVALPSLEKFTSSQAAILTACVELFADLGYAGTSVRDIAERVGIRSASLYKSFTSKQAMLDALNELAHTEFNRRELAAVLTAGEDPRDQLAAVVRSLVMMTCEFPRLTRIVQREVRHLSPPVLDRDQLARFQSAQILRDVVERGTRQGLFLEAEFTAVTVVLWGLALALASWFPYSGGVTAEQLADSYVEIALRIVGAKRGSRRSTPTRR
jgi:AcrR family transcriptional regulator